MEPIIRFVRGVVVGHLRTCDENSDPRHTFFSVQGHSHIPDPEALHSYPCEIWPAPLSSRVGKKFEGGSEIQITSAAYRRYLRLVAYPPEEHSPTYRQKSLFFGVTVESKMLNDFYRNECPSKLFCEMQIDWENYQRKVW